MRFATSSAALGSTGKGTLRRAIRRATVGPGEGTRPGGGRVAGERSLPDPDVLICRPPPPAEPFAYGDLVPLGFLLRAVDVGAPAASSVRRGLEDLLGSRRQGLLWPYHSGTLVTCIDSALVLQGFRDPAGVEALETFADGRGGYLPQLCSEEPERGKMVVTPRNRHWCQPEYGTTCLVTALRAEAGLECKTSVGYLAEGFENRGGLYFANPYMVDWALAWALQGVARNRAPSAIGERDPREHERGRLVRPVRHTDLHRPGDTGAGLARHRRRDRTPGALAAWDLMMPDGRWAASIPFYSAVTIPRERSGACSPGSCSGKGGDTWPGSRAPCAPSLCTSTSTI